MSWGRLLVVEAGLLIRALPNNTNPPHRPRVGNGRSDGSVTSSWLDVMTMGRAGVPMALILPPRQTNNAPKSLAAADPVPVPGTPWMTVPGSMFTTALLMT